MIRLNLSNIVIVALSVCCCFAFFSWYAYRILYYETAAVLKLKQQYAEHVLAYRKFMYNSQMLDSTEDEEEYSFDVVNRDFSYLRASALDYARDHKIEPMINAMYDPEWFPQTSISQAPHRRQPRRSRTVVNQPLSSGAPTVYRKELNPQLPLERSSFWISSRFGPRKKKNGQLTFHNGIDMAALKGTQVKSVAAGTIVEASTSLQGYGNCIVIEHSSKYRTRYAHLDSLKVKKGDKVGKGQLIGTVGSTGHVQGVNGKKSASHLHFEVMVYGNRINPLSVLS
jgi:murein DD-endopeptidase MepM/ murein hydrolase activator NlpD